jgi:predicted dehydrogenase
MTPTSPNARLRIGLVGGGMVGQLHIQAMQQVPGIHVAAIADLRPDLCRLVAGKYGIPRAYSSHLDLLADDSIDAVAVVVRRNATSTVVRDCLLGGKHVYSEKPMAMTREVAAELVELARQRNLHYAVGFQKRHDPAVAQCVELLSHLRNSGELGRLSLVRVWNHTGKDREEDHDLVMTSEVRPTGQRLDREHPDWLPSSYALSYDRFVNTYCHDLNMLNHLFAEEPSVRAAALEVFGGQSVILGYGDFLASMAFTLSEMTDWTARAEWDEGIEFHFEGGRLHMSFPPPLYRRRCAKVFLRRGSGPAEIVNDGVTPISTFTRQAANFLADIRGGRQSCSAAEVCLRDMKLIESIWRVGVAGSPAAASSGQ